MSLPRFRLPIVLATLLLSVLSFGLVALSAPPAAAAVVDTGCRIQARSTTAPFPSVSYTNQAPAFVLMDNCAAESELIRLRNVRDNTVALCGLGTTVAVGLATVTATPLAGAATFAVLAGTCVSATTVMNNQIAALDQARRSCLTTYGGLFYRVTPGAFTVDGPPMRLENYRCGQPASPGPLQAIPPAAFGLRDAPPCTAVIWPSAQISVRFPTTPGTNCRLSFNQTIYVDGSERITKTCRSTPYCPQGPNPVYTRGLSFIGALSANVVYTIRVVDQPERCNTSVCLGSNPGEIWKRLRDRTLETEPVSNIDGTVLRRTYNESNPNFQYWEYDTVEVIDRMVFRRGSS